MACSCVLWLCKVVCLQLVMAVVARSPTGVGQVSQHCCMGNTCTLWLYKVVCWQLVIC
jgi:hypothetical protein